MMDKHSSSGGKPAFGTGSGEQQQYLRYKIRFALNVTLKTVFLLVAINLLFALLYPMKTLGKISLYNHLFPGRERLPYGDNPDLSYNLSLYNLEAMFASQKLAGTLKTAPEFRVIVIGDSSTWGFLLKPDQTLAANLNASQTVLPDGRRITAYNLGYPVMSLTKDLLLLKYAMRYQPDLVVWQVTLESFPKDKQLFPPLLQNNPHEIVELINQYHIGLNPASSELKWPDFWEQTVAGSRRQLADLFRLQLYGPMWAATGIDQFIPANFEPPKVDFEPDYSFHNLQPPVLMPDDLALDVLTAGIQMAQPAEVILVNEPIFISQGKNSDIRYNFYYPRWAYDGYRKVMADLMEQNHWHYFDFWNAIEPSDFSNTAVHLTPAGSQKLSSLVMNAILETVQDKTE